MLWKWSWKARKEPRKKAERQKTWWLLSGILKIFFLFFSVVAVWCFIWFAVNIKAICGIISYCNHRVAPVVFTHHQPHNVSKIVIIFVWSTFFFLFGQLIFKYKLRFSENNALLPLGWNFLSLIWKAWKLAQLGWAISMIGIQLLRYLATSEWLLRYL